ncbi:MAG: hypothetical protein LKK19_05375 [Bacteroidales bacterium]|nr:hypothetical protein [Bacteroidales bacterium]MCI2122115.1 hypothetical protein [Bacteroidales bacterium]MCI2145626.1 hypothetical protein [Bacteroidales bacterium]
MKRMITCLCIAAVAAAGLMTAGCTKNYGTLSISWGSYCDTLKSGDTVRVPFTVNDLDKQVATGAGTSDSDGYAVSVSDIDKDGNGTITITAPGIIKSYGKVTFGLTVTDSKNDRNAVSDITMQTICHDMFKVEFKPLYDELSFSPNESKEIEFVVEYLDVAVPVSAKVVVEGNFTASAASFSKGATGTDWIGDTYPSDAYTGTFTVTAGSTVSTGETKFYVAVTDDYGRWTDSTIYPIITE